MPRPLIIGQLHLQPQKCPTFFFYNVGNYGCPDQERERTGGRYCQAKSPGGIHQVSVSSRHSRESWGGMPVWTGSVQSEMDVKPAGETVMSRAVESGSCNQEGWQGLRRADWDQ